MKSDWRLPRQQSISRSVNTSSSIGAVRSSLRARPSGTRRREEFKDGGSGKVLERCASAKPGVAPRHLRADNNVFLMRRRQTRWNPRADFFRQNSLDGGSGTGATNSDLIYCPCFVFMKTDLPPAGRRFTSRRWNAINKGSLQSKRIVSTWQRRRARR